MRAPRWKRRWPKASRCSIQRQATASDDPERLFGKVLAPHRDKIVLATKVKVGPDQNPDDWTRSVAGSLERLGTDKVDLLQLHGMSWPDPLAEWVLDHAVIDWLEAIRARGWTKSIGITAEVPSGGLERLIDTAASTFCKWPTA